MGSAPEPPPAGGDAPRSPREGLPREAAAGGDAPRSPREGVPRVAAAGGDAPRPPHESFRAGLRASVPFAIVAVVLSLSFGVLARQVGFSALGAIVMSAIVFAGSAQFAAVSILGGGGGVVAAIAAAALMNSRFLPMGAALAPSLPGRWFQRAAQGQAVVDASWAMSSLGDGSFDRWFLFGATAPQYVCWIAGTVLGALGGSILGDIDALGLDAVYPAFFLALLFAEMRDRRTRLVALAGASIALALVPFAPAGVPVLAASLAALAGLVARGSSPAPPPAPASAPPAAPASSLPAVPASSPSGVPASSLPAVPASSPSGVPASSLPAVPTSSPPGASSSSSEAAGS
jgi:4-azaleucine resistance transporter AzlC